MKTFTLVPNDNNLEPFVVNEYGVGAHFSDMKDGAVIDFFRSYYFSTYYTKIEQIDAIHARDWSEIVVTVELIKKFSKNSNMSIKEFSNIGDAVKFIFENYSEYLI